MANPCRRLTCRVLVRCGLLLLGFTVLQGGVAGSQTQSAASLQQASELEAQAGGLAKEGKFADAISSARKALAIREAVVVARQDAADTRLVAYVVEEQTNQGTKEQSSTKNPLSCGNGRGERP